MRHALVMRDHVRKSPVGMGMAGCRHSPIHQGVTAPPRDRRRLIGHQMSDPARAVAAAGAAHARDPARLAGATRRAADGCRVFERCKKVGRRGKPSPRFNPRGSNPPARFSATPSAGTPRNAPVKAAAGDQPGIWRALRFGSEPDLEKRPARPVAELLGGQCAVGLPVLAAQAQLGAIVQEPDAKLAAAEHR